MPATPPSRGPQRRDGHRAHTATEPDTGLTTAAGLTTATEPAVP